MDVLFTGLYPFWQYHFVAELNLLQEHLCRGDSVTVMTCNGELRDCEPNPNHRPIDCLLCMGIRRHGLSLVDGKPRVLPLIENKYLRATPPAALEQLPDHKALKQYQVDGFDLGMAVFSSLVDRTKDCSPDLSLHRRSVRSLAQDGWRVWLSANDLLARTNFSKVYIFNGRYAAARAWIRACERNQVPFVSHEKSGKLDRIHLYENQFPHEPTQYAARIRSFWEEQGGDPQVVQEGVEFYEERPRGKLTGWTSFVTSQQEALLPASWNPNRRNIAIYSSSDSELAGLVDLYSGGLYPDQQTAYREIVRSVADRGNDIFFYLRIHPNSATEKERWWDAEFFRTQPNLEVIPPESNVSTYALLQSVEKCIAFMSSAGVEATYWGKPSLVLGKSPYMGIDAAEEPRSHEEAIRWIEGRQEPKPKTNAVKYGSYMRCAGKRLVYSEVQNYYTLTFKGTTLEPGKAVHKWWEECRQRKPVTGLAQVIRNLADQLRFRVIRGRLS
jgi:hypothetical protein